MAQEKIVVIGMGMVGIHLVEKLLKSNKYQVEIFGEEHHVAYNVQEFDVACRIDPLL
jgi:NAD(P)H-nitrite reductase large subunit